MLQQPASFRQIKILYFALLAGQVVFALAVVALVTGPAGAFAASDELVTSPYLALGVVGLAAVGALTLNRLRADHAHALANRLEPPGVLAHYRTTVIMRSAVVEAGNLMVLVLTLLTGQLDTLAYFLPGIAMFVYFRPHLNEIIQVYRLDSRQAADIK